MKFMFSEDWLDRKLAQCDDANVAAAGTSLEHFKKNMEQRTVYLSSCHGDRNTAWRVAVLETVIEQGKL